MRFVFYFAGVLFLVVLQTAILPDLPGIIQFYDFIIAFVVYLSLYRPLSEGLPVLILAGMIMDMLSGAPLGVYLTSYFWIFVLFRQIPRWVGIREHVLFSWMVFLGVLFQNCLFSVAALLSGGAGLLAAQTFRIVLFQLLWAVVTAPLIWICLQYLFSSSEIFFKKGAPNGQ